MKSRDEAFALLSEYTKSESLIKHAFSVEAAMRWYADHDGLSSDEIEKWAITGLLHDFDYEMYPDPVSPDGHPYKGNQILAELAYPDDVRDAIMGHAEYTGVPRLSRMSKTLFAVDELCGLITASALVRPDKSLNNLQASSVKKKMKDKGFARGCNREDIKKGAEDIGLELELHIANVITAMRKISDKLGFS